eukprot:31145-Pelagococcus_subviridis.AAC.3
MGSSLTSRGRGTAARTTPAAARGVRPRASPTRRPRRRAAVTRGGRRPFRWNVDRRGGGDGVSRGDGVGVAARDALLDGRHQEPRARREVARERDLVLAGPAHARERRRGRDVARVDVASTWRTRVVVVFVAFVRVRAPRVRDFPGLSLRPSRRRRRRRLLLLVPTTPRVVLRTPREDRRRRLRVLERARREQPSRERAQVVLVEELQRLLAQQRKILRADVLVHEVEEPRRVRVGGPPARARLRVDAQASV